MDAAPSGFDGEEAHFVDVDKPIRHEVNVEPVHFVKFKDPQPAKLRPAAFDERQQVVPAFAGIFDVEHFLEGKRPHVERLSTQDLSGE